MGMKSLLNGEAENKQEIHLESDNPIKGVANDMNQLANNIMNSHSSSDENNKKDVIHIDDNRLNNENWFRHSEDNNGDHVGDSIKVGNKNQKTLTPIDHTYGFTDPSVIKKRNEVNDYFVKDIKDHFVYDVNDNKSSEEYSRYSETINAERYGKKFTGATTLLNSENNPVKKEIMENGLDKYDKTYINGGKDGKIEPPLSPLRPFTHMDPEVAHSAIINSYNRTLTPVADVEFRKCFKHYMFNRPECYVMCSKSQLCQQTEHDLDFTSTFSRLPHVVSLLAPSYVTGYFSIDSLKSNWNYLLSNRVLNVSDEFKTTIGVSDNVVKSVDGYSVAPGRTLESSQGATISVTFRETKYFEVFEFLRLWMMYIHKLKRGIFAPSYNGYQYANGYFGRSKSAVINGYPRFHPYDRAIDYATSLFQIVTNESMSKIVGWQKWYGIYPIDVSLSGMNGEGINVHNEITCTATFRYQKKEINNNRTLIEFNYNSGITDDLGFLKNTDKGDVPTNVSMNTNGPLKSYLGPTDMFTGAPYIILALGPKDPVTKANTKVPYLQFAGCKDVELNSIANTGLSVHTLNNTGMTVTTMPT